MILEIGEMTVKEGTEAEFLAAVAQAVPIFRRAKGCRSMQVRRDVAQARTYVLLVEWETLENHIVDFRESEDIKLWRGLVAHLWESPPRFTNHALAVEGF